MNEFENEEINDNDNCKPNFQNSKCDYYLKYASIVYISENNRYFLMASCGSDSFEIQSYTFIENCNPNNVISIP